MKLGCFYETKSDASRQFMCADEWPCCSFITYNMGTGTTLQLQRGSLLTSLVSIQCIAEARAEVRMEISESSVAAMGGPRSG